MRLTFVFNFIPKKCNDVLEFLLRKIQCFCPFIAWLYPRAYTCIICFCRFLAWLCQRAYIIYTLTKECILYAGCLCHRSISAIVSIVKDTVNNMRGGSETPCSHQASSSLDIRGFLLLKISQLCSCRGFPAWLYQRGWICARRLYCRGTYFFTTKKGGGEAPCSNQVSSSLDIKVDASEEILQTAERDLRVNREKHLNMSRDEKRTFYKDAITVEDIHSWNSDPYYHIGKSNYAVDEEINKKISVWKGDITKLEVDAVVNAANHHLGGGGGVDGAIHRAAGPELLKENQGLLLQCPTGEARVAAGYKMPAFYIIHTNGPQDGSEEMLKKCYESCLSEVRKNDKIRTVAFPGISTGIYGYPMEDATHVAAKAVREWLQANHDKVDRIIFCVYLDEAVEAAYKIIPQYFPR